MIYNTIVEWLEEQCVRSRNIKSIMPGRCLRKQPSYLISGIVLSTLGIVIDVFVNLASAPDRFVPVAWTLVE